MCRVCSWSRARSSTNVQNAVASNLRGLTTAGQKSAHFVDCSMMSPFLLGFIDVPREQVILPSSKSPASTVSVSAASVRWTTTVHGSTTVSERKTSASLSSSLWVYLLCPLSVLRSVCSVKDNQTNTRYFRKLETCLFLCRLERQSCRSNKSKWTFSWICVTTHPSSSVLKVAAKEEKRWRVRGVCRTIHLHYVILCVIFISSIVLSWPLGTRQSAEWGSNHGWQICVCIE